MKTIADIRIGDTVEVSGSEIHDDLAGLVLDITVSAITTSGDRIGLTDWATGSVVWFDRGEAVDRHRRAVGIISR